jgi:hypothetical protein
MTARRTRRRIGIGAVAALTMLGITVGSASADVVENKVVTNGGNQNDTIALPSGTTTIDYAVLAERESTDGGGPADCEVTGLDPTVIRIAVDPKISLRLAGGTLSDEIVSDKRVLYVEFTDCGKLSNNSGQIKTVEFGIATGATAGNYAVTHTKTASNAAVSAIGTSLDFTLVVTGESDGNNAPEVTVTSVTGTGTGSPDITDPFSVYLKSGNASITWSATFTGGGTASYQLKLGTCATGTNLVAAGTGYTSGDVTSTVAVGELGLDGSKTVSVCVTKASSTGGAAVTIVKDTVAPTAAVQFKLDGDVVTGPFIYGTEGVTAECVGTDTGGSGVASTTTPVLSTVAGKFLVDGVGTAEYSCTATDNAGNTSATATNSYQVYYGFETFTAPLNPDPEALNVAKAGRTIPLKWRLVDVDGVGVDTLLASNVKVRTTLLSCYLPGTFPDLVEEAAAGSSGLQNLGDGYYQFNWKTTTGLANSCRTLTLTLGDAGGDPRIALFEFIK